MPLPQAEPAAGTLGQQEDDQPERTTVAAPSSHGCPPTNNAPPQSPGLRGRGRGLVTLTLGSVPSDHGVQQLLRHAGLGRTGPELAWQQGHSLDTRASWATAMPRAQVETAGVGRGRRVPMALRGVGSSEARQSQSEADPRALGPRPGKQGIRFMAKMPGILQAQTGPDQEGPVRTAQTGPQEGCGWP